MHPAYSSPEPDRGFGAAEPEDFEHFFLRMYPRLILFASHRCPPVVADEIVSEVMYRLSQRWDQLNEATRDRYAYVAVRNATASWLKRASETPTILSLEELTVPAEAGDALRQWTSSTVEREIDGNDLAVRLFDYVENELTARERDVVLLFVAGFSHSEIATMLEIEPSSARSWLSNGRAKLRRFLRVEEGWVTW